MNPYKIQYPVNTSVHSIALHVLHITSRRLAHSNTISILQNKKHYFKKNNTVSYHILRQDCPLHKKHCYKYINTPHINDTDITVAVNAEDTVAHLTSPPL